jgi:beta-N-acetylhexosaminidase
MGKIATPTVFKRPATDTLELMQLVRAAMAVVTCGAVLATAATAVKPVKKEAVPGLTRWVRSLSLRDKVAQLVIMPVYGEATNVRSKQFRKYEHYVRDLHVGGLIITGHVQYGRILSAEPYAVAALMNRMQKMSKIPLFVGGDFERGASMRVSSTTQWPYAMAFSAARSVEAAKQEGAATAREARAIGVNWVFAPVADVNNNPENPIINIRSFGSDPQEVSKYVEAFIEGAHSEVKNQVLLTAKHFPGHGDTAEDSHLSLPKLDADRDRIQSVELAPFRAAIAAGVDSIMTAHLAVPALDPDNIPASVSPKILTGLLRGEMQYKGLIVTDAMDMQGLTLMFDNSEAAVRAIEAGSDVLLMPRSAEEAINGVAAAVRSGRISQKRLDESVTRVLAAKMKLGLLKSKPVDLHGIGDVVDAPEDEEEAQVVADHAVTLVKDSKDMVPLRKAESACLFALAENRYGRQGWRLMEESQKRAPKMTVTLLDPKMSKADLDQAAQSASGCSQIIVAAFVSVSAYRGSVALAGNYPDFLNGLLAGNVPVTLISLGNPYLARSFPNAAAYLTTFSSTQTSEAAVIKSLFGEIPITGHLPVAIPGFAKYGDGIQLPATKTP